VLYVCFVFLLKLMDVEFAFDKASIHGATNNVENQRFPVSPCISGFVCAYLCVPVCVLHVSEFFKILISSLNGPRIFDIDILNILTQQLSDCREMYGSCPQSNNQ
jgi:hypothetical protein